MYGFSSCKVFYPNLMFKTTKKDLTPDSLMIDTSDAFLIKPGDVLDFQIFSNKGFRLVDFGLEQQQNAQQNFNRAFNSCGLDRYTLFNWSYNLSRSN